MARDAVCFVECSMCSWEECVFCCEWVESSVNDSVLTLVGGVQLALLALLIFFSLFFQLLREECWGPHQYCGFVYFSFLVLFFPFSFCILYFEAATRAPLGACSQVKAVRENKRRRRKIAAYVWAGHFTSLPLFSSPWESSGSCFLYFAQSFSCNQWGNRLQWAYSPTWPHMDFEHILLLALNFPYFPWISPLFLARCRLSCSLYHVSSPGTDPEPHWSGCSCPSLGLDSSCLSVSSPAWDVSHIRVGAHDGLVQLGTPRPTVHWHRGSGSGSSYWTNYFESAA